MPAGTGVAGTPWKNPDFRRSGPNCRAPIVVLPMRHRTVAEAIMTLPFTKMHGLGNDFVVVDARPGRPGAGVAITEARASAIADRHTGVGCDQLIRLEADMEGAAPHADAFMRIHNADGGIVEACGNATRCVGAVLLEETGRPEVRIRTASGLLTAHGAGPGLVMVNMGAPRFDWRQIPLVAERETLHLALELGTLRDPAAASMGNPHVTFFVSDPEAVPLADLGPILEHHEMFPERVNVGVAAIAARDRMRLRVWERGAGLTLACGTAACAAVANAHRRGLCGRTVAVEMDGGELGVVWREDGNIEMIGPAAVSFTGVYDTGAWS